MSSAVVAKLSSSFRREPIAPRTRSLLLMQIMHAFYTGTLLVLTPAGLDLSQSLTWETLFMVLLCSVTIRVAVLQHPQPVGNSPAGGAEVA